MSRREGSPNAAAGDRGAPEVDYRSAGVDYEALDEGKRLAMAQALATSPLLDAHGARALDASRGQPAFVFELDGRALALVVEGLGTKSIIARQVLERLALNRFDAVAYDTVAAIVNDLCCVGALPLVVNAYFATGASDWHREPSRASALVAGWREACEDAGCAWGGGESPTLPELVAEHDVELAGSAIGALARGTEPILGEQLAAGDEIVIVSSSGLHANGSSLARAVAARLPDGYATPLRSGRLLGDALLDRSFIYVGLIERLLGARLPITYLSHITGHGLAKLMRPPNELTYEIARLPPVPEVLEALVATSALSPRDAYATFNMGCGFAVYCRPGSGEAVVAAARDSGHEALIAGTVRAGPRRVVLEPLGLTYDSDSLELAPPSGA
jgi:phosphoribosylformylglycinamidine cyclo-ligase